MARTQTASIYDTITNQIIASLELGAGKFSLPWHRSNTPLSRPMNAVTRKTYRGVNVLALWASADAQDFGHGLWATYRQWQSLGAQVRKGEKASSIVFYKVFDKVDGKEAEEREGSARIFAQASHVFNVGQVDGYAMPELPEGADFDPIPNADAFVAATSATIRIQGDSAHYTPSTDTITMPDKQLFFATESGNAGQNWYATLLHEVGNIASVLVAGGAGEGAVERYLRHLHCGEQSPGGGRLDARTAAGAATQRCGVIGIAAGASGIRRRLPASRSSAVLAR